MGTHYATEAQSITSLTPLKHQPAGIEKDGTYNQQQNENNNVRPLRLGRRRPGKWLDMSEAEAGHANDLGDELKNLLAWKSRRVYSVGAGMRVFGRWSLCCLLVVCLQCIRCCAPLPSCLCLAEAYH